MRIFPFLILFPGSPAPTNITDLDWIWTFSTSDWNLNHLSRIRIVETSPINIVEIPPKWLNFVQNSRNSTFFLAEFRPIFGIVILLCGFAHFWKRFMRILARNEQSWSEVVEWFRDTWDMSYLQVFMCQLLFSWKWIRSKPTNLVRSNTTYLYSITLRLRCALGVYKMADV
jgi:hypothetical protein